MIDILVILILLDPQKGALELCDPGFSVYSSTLQNKSVKGLTQSRCLLGTWSKMKSKKPIFIQFSLIKRLFVRNSKNPWACGEFIWKCFVWLCLNFNSFQVLNGPIVNVQLKAFVTMPEIQLSTEFVDFNDVICGECKVVTIQLDNVTKVRYLFTYSSSSVLIWTVI